MSAALTPIRVETGFWLILWLGLTAGIGLETDWGRQMTSPVTQIAETPPEFPKPVLAEPFRLPPPDQFLDVTVRPIFVATRRSAPIAPPPEPPKPGMKKDQFILMGTTIVAGGKFAFLLERAGNKSRVVAEGKEINGIIVKEVATERVVLSQYDDTEVLVLKMNRPPPRSPTPPAVAPRAGPPAGPRPFFGGPQPQQVPAGGSILGGPQPQAPAGTTIGPR